MHDQRRQWRLCGDAHRLKPIVPNCQMLPEQLTCCDCMAIVSNGHIIIFCCFTVPSFHFRPQIQILENATGTIRLYQWSTSVSNLQNCRSYCRNWELQCSVVVRYCVIAVTAEERFSQHHERSSASAMWSTIQSSSNETTLYSSSMISLHTCFVVTECNCRAAFCEGIRFAIVLALHTNRQVEQHCSHRTVFVHTNVSHDISRQLGLSNSVLHSH